jgi:hypothetical protein
MPQPAHHGPLGRHFIVLAVALACAAALLAVPGAGHGFASCARDAKGNVPLTHYLAIAIALAISLVLDLWNELKDFWHDYGPDLSPPHPQGSLSDLQQINKQNIIHTIEYGPGGASHPMNQ